MTTPCPLLTSDHPLPMEPLTVADRLSAALDHLRAQALDAVDQLTKQRDAAQQKLDEVVAQLDASASERDHVYMQRGMLGALVARSVLADGGKAGVKVDLAADPDFQTILFIDLPTGQVSFHYHIDDAYVFLKDMPTYEGVYDEHDNAEKWARVCTAYAFPA